MADLVPAVDLAIDQPGSKESESIDLGGRLLAYSFDDHANMADECLLTLDNSDLAFWDDPRLRMNQRLTVCWGYRGRMTNKRRCVIVGMRGSLAVQLKLHGEAVKLDRVPHPRCFENMSHSAIVKQIAQEHGFGASEFIEDTKVVHASVVQPAISDGQFIRRLAQRSRFEFFIKGGVLHFHSPKLAQAPKKVLTYRTDGKGEIIDCPTIEEERHGTRGAVKAKGIDPMTKKPFAATGSNAETKRPGVGKCIVAVDQRTQQVSGVPPECVDEVSAPSSARNEQEAKRRVDGEFKESQKHIKMSMTIVGDPDIVARDLVTVNGIGRRFSGPWYIVDAKTNINDTYLMNLELSRDAHNGYGDQKKDIKSKADVNKKEVDEAKVEQHGVFSVDQRTQQAIGWRKKS